MARTTMVTVAMLILLAGAAPSADEKESSRKKPVGTWKRTVGDHSITFKIKTDTLQTMIKAGDQVMEIDADYGVSKDGVLFARISHVRKEGDGPGEGDLFSFRFSVDNETLTISDLKTPHDSGDAKDLVQGEYQKQKG